MAIVDLIDDYSTGTTGSLTDSDGQTFTYSVTQGVVNSTLTSHGPTAAKIFATGSNELDVDFDAPVIGLSITMRGSDSNEFYGILIDGVLVDLNQMFLDGEVTLTNAGSTSNHTINLDGTVSGGTNTDGSIGILTFTIPITSIGIVGVGGQNSGNWDGFDIGVESTIFDVLCFAYGTQISAKDGPRLIQNLCVGDSVLNVDGLESCIRWIGSRSFSHTILQKHPHLYPIRICADALGNGYPKNDLLVSRQHRLLISSKAAERMFGASEVLISAIKLTELPGIYVDTSVKQVTYFHLLFDDHEILLAEGTPAESLHTGQSAWDSIPDEARQEIVSLFPELAAEGFERAPARFIPTGKKQKKLVERIIKNKKQNLVSAG